MPDNTYEADFRVRPEEDVVAAEDLNRVAENVDFVKDAIDDLSEGLRNSFSMDSPLELRVSDNLVVSIAYWVSSTNRPWIVGRVAATGGAMTRADVQFWFQVNSAANGLDAT